MNDYNLHLLLHMANLVLLGLSGGLFYAWQVSVVPGTLKLSDPTYLETMKSINKEILNPYFFVIFFGALLFALVDAGVHLFHTWSLTTLWVTLAAVFYVLTVGITALGNVPLNNELAALPLHECSADELKNFRSYYEVTWNKYHLFRTWTSVAAFIFIIIGTINLK